MLYLSPTRSGCIRIHAPWVPLEDVKKLADKIRKIEEVRLAEEARKEKIRLDEEARKAEESRKKEEAKRLKEEALRIKEDVKPQIPSSNEPEQLTLAKDFEIDWAKQGD